MGAWIALGLGFLMTQAATAAQNFPADLPTFACEIKPLTRSGLKIAKANRERFAKLCLACIEDECAMRIWPAGYEERETLCRNTYCLPKKVRRMAFSEGYNMNYRYRYQVSADGVTTVIDGEYLEGEPKGVTGKKTKIEHREMLNKLVSRVEYEPIVIEGRAKALINLETFWKIGVDYEK
jgi:hypothetical protein